MSAPITESHIALAARITRENGYDPESKWNRPHVLRDAQYIADSEARAKESLLVAYDVVCEVRNRLTTERDRLRAEVADLTQSRDNWESACKANDACVVQFKARAERAEAEIKDRAAMMRDVMRERDAAEAELAAERARLDWVFRNCKITINDYRDVYAIHDREDLGAAMKGNAK
jgi:hypothetical protein